MDKEKNKFEFKKALFPGVMAVLAFVCFAFVYWFLTACSIEPLFFLGLIFIIPALVFTLIAGLAGKGKLNNSVTIIFTVILIPVFMIASFFSIFIIGLSQTSVTITDASRYERTMKMGGFSRKEVLKIFPEKIPKGASNVDFYYNESSWQEYDQTVVLRFSANQSTISSYIQQFNEITAPEESENTKNVFDRVGNAYIKDLPSDYAVYVIINEGNHNRKVSAVSISQERNEIIFYAYIMIW